MKNKTYTHIAFGLVVVALGAGFMLDALNFVDFNHILGTWWPVAVILFGITSWASSPRQPVWPLIITVGGVLLQLRQLDIISFNVWALIWPTILIVAGLSLLFGGKRRSHEVTKDHIDAFAAFSGIDSKNKSGDFKGGNITALFGGISLDLREASLKNDANLEIFAAFGGVDIRVPENWTVRTSGLPLFGGWEDKTTRPSDKKAKTLTIHSACLFGGFSVKN